MLHVHDLSHISVQRYGKFSEYANFLREKIQLAVFGRTATSSGVHSRLLFVIGAAAREATLHSVKTIPPLQTAKVIQNTEYSLFVSNA